MFVSDGCGVAKFSRLPVVPPSSAVEGRYMAHGAMEPWLMEPWLMEPWLTEPWPRAQGPGPAALGPGPAARDPGPAARAGGHHVDAMLFCLSILQSSLAPR